MAVIERVGAPNVRFLAELYHLAKIGEDVAAVITSYRDRIMHVQVADPPGPGAAGTGTLDFEPAFAALARDGYTGWAGLEYVTPDRADSTESFAWLPRATGRRCLD